MIAIIDCNMGNLGSIFNMLKKIGHESVITNDHDIIANASKIILPGVGAFDKAIENLERFRLTALLNELVLVRKKPILGICLGMQLFSRLSEEGSLSGLGWIDARTIRFKFDDGNAAQRIPHMGWNRIVPHRVHPILSGMPEDSRFYFVHSYHVSCADESNVLATAEYGIPFCAAVVNQNIVGTQFHPEKSHKFGLRLLKNFVEMD